jgi:hypothetical protein
VKATAIVSAFVLLALFNTAYAQKSQPAVKIHSGNKSIEQQMQESKQKADNARSAATTGLTIGVAQGAASIGSASSGLAKKSTPSGKRK